MAKGFEGYARECVLRRSRAHVGLLSRPGEIAIAKRIEAGREAMIAGLCESPLTFQAIII
jgi:RNA polymerase primary sigma factor